MTEQNEISSALALHATVGMTRLIDAAGNIWSVESQPASAVEPEEARSPAWQLTPEAAHAAAKDVIAAVHAGNGPAAIAKFMMNVHSQYGNVTLKQRMEND